MSTRLLIPVAVAISCLACSGIAQPPGPEVPRIVPGTPAVGEEGAAAAPSPSPEPVDPGPCADDCLLLMDHLYEDLQNGGYCKLCKEADPQACELDWPSSDLIACDEADRLRNCIYARLGYDFATAPEWRRVFEKEDWYEVDPGFQWSDVTEVQVANANTLKEIVKRRRCAR